MSDILINTTSSIFDMFLVMIYYSKMFTERKNTLLALENQGTFDYNDEEAYVGNNSWR